MTFKSSSHLEPDSSHSLSSLLHTRMHKRTQYLNVEFHIFKFQLIATQHILTMHLYIEICKPHFTNPSLPIIKNDPQSHHKAQILKKNSCAVPAKINQDSRSSHGIQSLSNLQMKDPFAYNVQISHNLKITRLIQKLVINCYTT